MSHKIKTTIIVNAEVEVEFEGTVEELLELQKQLNTLNAPTTVRLALTVSRSLAAL